jgi:hypothetical protein
MGIYEEVSLALAAVIGHCGLIALIRQLLVERAKHASSEGVFLVLWDPRLGPPLEPSVGVHKRGVGGRRRAFLGCYSFHSPRKAAFRWQTRTINTSTALAEPAP